mmetsp:Transcript_145497/g.253890  ORF Transcript_145497/g.253890 Transcript_145497/m.253890 type:complete len:131 (+) Transcript_145497:153-545(+)
MRGVVVGLRQGGELAILLTSRLLASERAEMDRAEGGTSLRDAPERAPLVPGPVTWELPAEEEPQSMALVKLLRPELLVTVGVLGVAVPAVVLAADGLSELAAELQERTLRVEPHSDGAALDMLDLPALLV